MSVYRIMAIVQLASLFSYLPLHSKSFSSFNLGLSISAGYTALDFEAVSGYPDSLMDDWDQFHYKITAYGLFPFSSKLSAGLELGYNYLYYYYYRIPYGPSPVYREAQWSTISCLGMVHYDLSGPFFVQAGAGIHTFIDDGTALALSGAFGIKPHFGDIHIPVFIRIDPIFGAGTPITISAGAGVEWSRRK